MLKKIIGLSLIGFTAICLSAGSTWALGMSDTQSPSGNTATSGTLNLTSTISGSYPGGSGSLYHVTDGADGLNDKVVFDKVAPGQSGTIKWVLANTGTVAGTFAIVSTVAFADGDSANEVELFFNGNGGRPSNNGGSNGDLDQYLMVTLQKGQGVDQSAAEAAFSYILGSAGSPVAISGLEAVLDAQTAISLGASGGSDTLVYLLSWSLSGSEANISVVQGDTAEIDMTFSLNQ